MSQKVIQVAGFSNSGKTTLVEKLVTALTKANFRVGTIKHHGHGDELTSHDYGKDSWKHRQAGAIVSSAVSGGNLQLQISQQQEWEAETLVGLYSQFPIDIIVIEGFKAATFPKIVLLKEEEDLKLLKKLNNIFCVISWFPIDESLKTDNIAYFTINDETEYLKYMLQKLKGQGND